MIWSTGVAGGSLVMVDSVCATVFSTAGPVLEFPRPGEPEDPEAGGGGKGPCCWARIGETDAARVHERNRPRINRWRITSVVLARFSALVILGESIQLCVWTN